MRTKKRPAVDRILLPHVQEVWRGIREKPANFVYYTSAEVAESLLKTKTLWLRNAQMMNDFMEIEQGLENLHGCFQGQSGKRLEAAWNSCFPGVADEIKEHFDAWVHEFRTETYIMCVSEHCKEEDLTGRLSMWRAYGGRAGIALVFGADVLADESLDVGAYTMPVLYMDAPSLQNELDGVATQIDSRQEEIKSCGRDWLRWEMFYLLLSVALSSKHPGFAEEREWRIVSSRSFRNESVRRDVEVVGGIPQPIVKLRLDEVGELQDILKKVIIGPCASPLIVMSALEQLLQNAGVNNARERIVISNIPLR